MTEVASAAQPPARGVAPPGTTPAAPAAQHPAVALLKLAAPAVVIGVLSSLVLISVSGVADKLEHVLWSDVPNWLNVSGSSDWWIMLVLTLTGLAVGVVVW